MVRKAELAVNTDAARLGLHALEFNAVVELVDFHAVKQAVKVEMPPRAAEFAVGRKLQTDLFLLFDDLLDLAIFDLGELRSADLAFFPLRARFLQWRGAQDAADNIGAKRRLVSHHWDVPLEKRFRVPIERGWRQTSRSGAFSSA